MNKTNDKQINLPIIDDINNELNHKFTKLPNINANNINDNDRIILSKFEGSHSANCAYWSSKAISFDELCKAIAKKLQDDGIIPIAGD